MSISGAFGRRLATRRLHGILWGTALMLTPLLAAALREGSRDPTDRVRAPLIGEISSSEVLCDALDFAPTIFRTTVAQVQAPLREIAGLQAVAASGPIRLTEASAVAVIGSTAIVAGDEQDELWWGVSGSALSERRELRLPAEVKITDVEGLAPGRGREQIYAITSHSRNKEGARKPKRERLVCATLTAGAAGIESMRLYSDLRDALVKHLVAAFPARLSAEDVDKSLNIEGLAHTDDTLWIGVRRPTVDGQAILIPLRNAEALCAAPDSKPSFGKVILLASGGRGIRDLTNRSESQMIVLLGPEQDEKNGSFQLATFAPADGALHVLTGSAAFTGLVRPEGVAWDASDGGSLIVVQDLEDGDDGPDAVRLEGATLPDGLRSDAAAPVDRLTRAREEPRRRAACPMNQFLVPGSRGHDSFNSMTREE